MVENPVDQTNFNKVSQEFTTMLVRSVLKKHGFNKENVKSVSEEEREHLKNLIENLRTQLENLTKPVAVSGETSETPDKKKRSK
jgi:hypothetical protein